MLPDIIDTVHSNADRVRELETRLTALYEHMVGPTPQEPEGKSELDNPYGMFPIMLAVELKTKTRLQACAYILENIERVMTTSGNSVQPPMSEVTTYRT